MKAKHPNVKRETSSKVVYHKPAEGVVATQDAVHVATTEESVPLHAGEAFSAASRRAQAAGFSTVEISDDQLILVSSEGKRTFIKTVEPDIPVVVGKKIKLR